MIEKRKHMLMVLTSILAFLKSILSVIFALILKKLLEYFEIGSKEEIYGQVVWTALFLVFYLIVEIMYNYFESNYKRNKMVYLKTNTMDAILKKTLLFYNKHHTGEYLSMLTNDAKALEDDYYGNIFECISMVFNLCVSIIVLIYLSPILGIVSVLSSFLSLVIPVIISNKLNIFREKYSIKQDYLTRKIKSILDGFETIKTYDVEKLAMEEYIDSVKNVEQHNQKLSFFIKSTSAIGRLMAYIVFFVIIFTGLFLSIQGKITFGVLMASIQLSNNLVTPIVVGVQTMAKIKSVKNIRNKFEELEEEQQSDRKEKCVTFEHSILLKDVSFSYNDESIVLKNVTMEIEKGKKYAIVGVSGSGKSTLGKILMGVYEQYTGEILYDNENIRQCNTETVTKLFSVINQNIFLLDDTVEKNVSFYKSVSPEKVEKALRAVQLSQFIDMKNTIGENGVLLSGGEKQRLSLARAFTSNCPIILMDEATSQLDNENMDKIENLVLDSDKTVISITHRLVKRVLQKYDKIYIISKGHIVEQGTFDELISEKGLLYSLYYIYGD
ncbi:MAG: ABC transporter ATP-binding protein [Lachnospiraceae bacterium]|nr:ABC transporter ATP-binding protein [Lachnospiraceae bacterium]